MNAEHGPRYETTGLITALYTHSDGSQRPATKLLFARLESVVGRNMQTAMLVQPRAMFGEMCFQISASLNDFRRDRSKLDVCTLRLWRQASRMQGASISQHHSCYRHNVVLSVLMSAAGGGESHYLKGIEISSAAAERHTGAHVGAQSLSIDSRHSNVFLKCLCCCRARLRLIKQQAFQKKGCTTCLSCPSARSSCHKRPSPSSSLSHVIGYCSS